jgi:hypothetical protein
MKEQRETKIHLKAMTAGKKENTTTRGNLEFTGTQVKYNTYTERTNKIARITFRTPVLEHVKENKCKENSVQSTYIEFARDIKTLNFTYYMVPKYRSPNSPIPGITWHSSFKPNSISDVTILILGNFLQTACIPSGAWAMKK